MQEEDWLWGRLKICKGATYKNNKTKTHSLVQLFYGPTHMEPMLTFERLFPAFIYHSSEMLIPHKFFSFKFQMSSLNLVAK